MVNRNDFISLLHEKRELDAFLSTFTQPPDDEPIPQAGFVKDERPPIILEEYDSEIRSEQKIIDALDTPADEANLYSSLPETHGSLHENPVPALNEPISPPETSIESEVAKPEMDASANLVSDDRPMPAEPDVNPQEDHDELVDLEEEEVPKKRKSLWIVLAVLIFIVASVVGAIFWIYPDKENPAVQWLSANVPIIDQYLGEGQAPKATISDQIRLLNVRQRIIKNPAIGGDIRIIEGMAENLTNTTITKIKVLGELYDTRQSLLTAKISFCGNIISDDNLANLSEEDIKSSLAAPTGVDLSSGKIPPKGQIPFMIIFTRDIAGVAKASVTPIGFEKVE
ncbi:MAG: hypothetical protein CSYNP_02613 [Syntrophus sp. SKADARSKE-3]|nr:hypothetical protein [Syntrophus sp. SKADARSKE-3]